MMATLKNERTELIRTGYLEKQSEFNPSYKKR